MLRFTLVWILLSTISLCAFGQNNGFKFGSVSTSELQMTSYAADTSAVAIVLEDFGEAFVDPDSYNIIFERHYKIKILKTEGLSYANIFILLYNKNSNAQEKLITVKAASYNYEDGKTKVTNLDTKSLFTERINKDYEGKKFALSDVRVGTVIEVSYTIDSPYIQTFRSWTFQSDIPTIKSEYWAKIPGNYQYNISLQGYQKLTSHENSIVKECLTIGSGYQQSSADCVLHKFIMTNVPALIEEDYMTSEDNYLSAVNFELTELRRWDGQVNKYTKEWKDADLEVRNSPSIGGQLKKGKEIYALIAPSLNGITDDTEKAKAIYNFIKSWYVWNGFLGIYGDDGIKKAFDKKTGDVADINLSLVAALRQANLAADLVLLTTRDHKIVTELFPVLTDFTYVIAKVDVGGKSYLLDATDGFLPFGVLPFRCLSGKGRVFPDKAPSYWVDLKPTEKAKTFFTATLAIDAAGKITGKIVRSFHGYEAIAKRKQISSFTTVENYVEDLKKQSGQISFSNYALDPENNESKVQESFDVEIEGEGDIKAGLLWSPFNLFGKLDKNPFRSNQRLYPVDYGTTTENTIILNLTYPETLELVSKPDRTTLSLPANGGKFLFDVVNESSKATMNYSFTLAKPIYNSQEYHYLKELYNRMIYVQHTDWLFKSK